MVLIPFFFVLVYSTINAELTVEIVLLANDQFPIVVIVQLLRLMLQAEIRNDTKVVAVLSLHCCRGNYYLATVEVEYICNSRKKTSVQYFVCTRHVF